MEESTDPAIQVRLVRSSFGKGIAKADNWWRAIIYGIFCTQGLWSSSAGAISDGERHRIAQSSPPMPSVLPCVLLVALCIYELACHLLSSAPSASEK
eukprot:1159870-Pelagomonas_calceolata.AAC.14